MTKEDIKAYNKSYYKKNRTKILSTNREERLEKKKQYRIKNKGQIEQYRIDNKEKIRNGVMLYRYGISTTEYTNLFQKQNGCCAICNKPQSNFVENFSVDHSHDNNKIRGLLCHKCNLGIGLLEDDENILLKAYNYLKSYK